MILGHDRQIKYFDTLIKKGRLAHAYLFYGPENVGKFTIAKYIIEKLSCPQPIILDTENTLVSKKDARKDIPIDDIRELKRLFSFTVPAGEWRVAVVNEVEKMSPAASDAFLKLLEEPGERTLFFLITSSPELLSRTVVSRAQSVRFSQVSAPILQEFLEGKVLDGVEIQEIISFCAGRPGIMMRFLEDRDYFSDQKKLFKNVALFLSSGEIPEAFLLSEKISADDAKRQKVIEYVMRIIRAGFLKNNSLEGTAALVTKLKKINRISTLLATTNINARLGMDVLFMEALARN